MGTLASRMRNCIKNTFQRLGENDVSYDLDDFMGTTSLFMGNEDLAELKAALFQVEKMEKDYIAGMRIRNSRGKRLAGVESSKQGNGKEPIKANTNPNIEKDRED